MKLPVRAGIGYASLNLPDNLLGRQGGFIGPKTQSCARLIIAHTAICQPSPVNCYLSSKLLPLPAWRNIG